MTREEAHAALDALKAGSLAMTEADIRRALLATGDLCRSHIPSVVRWPFMVAEQRKAA